MVLGLRVTDKTQNGTVGYWGEIDTTTTFCEPHYKLSPYIAEFFNAWTSLVYTFVGIYIIRKYYFNDYWNRMAGGWLIAIGLGSFMFHATMRYSMQLMDELPMVGFIWTVIMHKTASTQSPFIQKHAKAIQVFTTVQAILLGAVYIYWDQYEWFLHGFTFMVLYDGVFAYMLRSKGEHFELKQKVHIYGSIFIVVGKAMWEIENQLCGTVPSIWPMHTIWHFCSAASAYNTCFFNYLSCLDDADDKINYEIPKLFGWTKTLSARAANGSEKKKKV